MFRSIKDPSDHQALQNDLNKLAHSHWSSIRQMPFLRSLFKCEYLIVTKKSSPLVYHYRLNDYKIQTEPHQLCKYLGVTISSNLSWSTHICDRIGLPHASKLPILTAHNFRHVIRSYWLEFFTLRNTSIHSVKHDKSFSFNSLFNTNLWSSKIIKVNGCGRPLFANPVTYYESLGMQILLYISFKGILVNAIKTSK